MFSGTIYTSDMAPVKKIQEREKGNYLESIHSIHSVTICHQKERKREKERKRKDRGGGGGGGER